MAKGSRRRWLVGGVVLLVVAGAIGGSVAMRLAKKDDGKGKNAAPVTLEFAPADLTRVEARALARWLPVSGALQPVRQATVKAKVSGDVKQITVREGETVQAGQVLARIDTADLEAKLIERVGALESAKAQLAMAEKTRTSNQMLLKQNFISQNAFDNSESSYNVAQGSREVGGGAGADREERAARRRRRLAAHRARRQAARPAGREGRLRLAARHRRRPEGHGAAGDGAGGRRARSSPSASRSSSPSTASASAGSRAASSGSTRRPSRARARSSSTSGFRTRTARCAAACSRPAASRSPRARRCRRCRRRPCAPRAARSFVWTIEDGKLVAAASSSSARATTPPDASRSGRRCRRGPGARRRASTT